MRRLPAVVAVVATVMVVAPNAAFAAAPSNDDDVADARSDLTAALTLALVTSGTESGAGSLDGPAPRPNIVVLMVDDMGAIDERLLERLPSINRYFLQRGVRFTEAHTETPLCCPARATLLTGQHVANHGVDRNDVRLLDPTRTIATAMQDAGYFTAWSGKYLNRIGQLADTTPPGWNRVAFHDRGYYDNTWWVQGRRSKSPDYSVDVLTGHALRFLDKAPADKPVFMVLSPLAPHGNGYDANGDPTPPLAHPRHQDSPLCKGIEPWHPPNSETGRPLVAECEALLAVDDLWTDVRRRLAAQGRLAGTLVVFMSDNGMAWGAHGWPTKYVPYATRLPLYVAWHGVRGTTPRVETGLLSNIDLAPTLADIAGASMPWADGVSIAPAFRDEPWQEREDMLESYPYAESVETQPWHGVRTPQWHYIEWQDGRVELYDTDADPWEMDNVASYSAYAGTAADLAARLDALRDE